MIDDTSKKYEPNRENRFSVNLKGLDIPGYLIQNIDKPKYDLKNKEWTNINITIVDIPSTPSKVIFDNINNMHDNDHEITIKSLSPIGETVLEMKIIGNYTLIDFGKCDYASEEISTIKLEFKPKKIEI